jgi:sugar phosphate isomerase/epimerase
MPRPITLFTGQWADLALEELAAKSARWGYDGLELATWGDHFDVEQALADAGYVRAHYEILERHGLSCHAISAHLVGQAVCDPIDERHGAMLPPAVWGDGDPEGVRRRAANRVMDTARAAARLGVRQVNGFTGSSVWRFLYSFPPNDWAAIERGYEDFAARWPLIIDVFDAEGVRFGLEVHPTEIAYDFVTTRKALAAIDRRDGFGINFDPSHFAHQRSTRRRSWRNSPIASITPTSRTRRGGSTGGGASSALISTSAHPSAAGISSPLDTGTSTSRL